MSLSLNKPVLCPIIVGRTPYLDMLKQYLSDAQNGHGQTLLLAGESGIGKSRLVAEAKIGAEQNGLTIFQGNCFEPDRVVPYAPFLDLLRAYIRSDSIELLKPYTSELVKLVPELQTLLPTVIPSPPLEPAQEKLRYFQTLDYFIGRELVRSLVIIEDIHWCDDTSLEYLLRFAHRIPSASTLLLLTYRNDELNPSLRHFLAELDGPRPSRQRNDSESIIAG